MLGKKRTLSLLSIVVLSCSNLPLFTSVQVQATELEGVESSDTTDQSRLVEPELFVDEVEKDVPVEESTVPETNEAFSESEEEPGSSEVRTVQSISNVFPDTYVAEAIRAALGKTTVDDEVTTEELAGIKELNLTANPIGGVNPNPSSASNLEGVQNLTGLTRLQIGGTNVSDLTPISNLISLEKFDCPASKIVDLSPMSKLVNIKDIYASYNQITDVTPLAKITNLESLVLFDTAVESVAPLKKLRKLKRLNVVSGAVVKDWASLANSPVLADINARYSDITDPSLFEIGFPALTKIQLTDQQIEVKDSIRRDATGSLSFENIIVDAVQTAIEPSEIYDDGIYTEATNTIVWAALAPEKTSVQYEFNKSITIRDMQVVYSGTVTIPVEAPVAVIPGDLNGDGEVDVTDLLLLKNYVLTEIVPSKYDRDKFLKAADMNQDGEVTAADYLLLKRAVLGS